MRATRPLYGSAKNSSILIVFPLATAGLLVADRLDDVDPTGAPSRQGGAGERREQAEGGRDRGGHEREPVVEREAAELGERGELAPVPEQPQRDAEQRADHANRQPFDEDGAHEATSTRTNITQHAEFAT